MKKRMYPLSGKRSLGRSVQGIGRRHIPVQDEAPASSDAYSRDRRAKEAVWPYRLCTHLLKVSMSV
jgi:hypothetical protein